MRISTHHVVGVALAALICGAAAGQETELKTGEVRASHLLGAVVKRLTGDSVGEVKDLIVSADSNVKLAVISVGGVLGVGGKTVGLPFDQFMVAPDGGTLFLTMPVEQLEAWPAFDLESIQTDARSAADEPVSPLGETTFEANDFAAADAAPSALPDNAQPAELVQPAESAQSAESAQPAETQPFVATEPLSEAEQLAVNEQIPEAQQLVQPDPVAQSEPLVQPDPLAQSEPLVQPDPLAQSEQLAQAEQLTEETQIPQAEPERAVSKSKAENQPASALIGAQVVDTQDSAIGKVNDVVVTAEPPEVQVIVELSERLGGASRLVAVPLPELTIKQDAGEQGRGQIESVETRLTVAQLDALPSYQY